MKVCPNCNQQYDDDELNFCLNDGGILTKVIDDAAPTIMLNKARTTNQNWSYSAPISPWQSQAPQQQQHHQQPLMQPHQQQWRQASDQTLPVISLIMGILSILLGCWCGGFYFGIAALITGYIGINNVNNNPQIYSGKGMAIAGIVLGAVSFLGAILLILLAIFGSFS